MISLECESNSISSHYILVIKIYSCVVSYIAELTEGCVLMWPNTTAFYSVVHISSVISYI